MLLTPEEAKKKLCPRTFNTDVRAHGAWNCLADECMCWRWQHSLTVNNPSRVPGAGTQEVRTDKGFCGLGGQP